MESQPTLTHHQALAVVDAVRTELDRRGAGAAVAVCDDHGELVAFLRTDGCRLPSITIAMNKAYTAAREQAPSKDVGAASRDQGFPMTNFGELRYVSWGGGLPLTASGRVVGAVGVSGLPEDEDIELAELGRATFASIQDSPVAVDRGSVDRVEGLS